MNSINRDEKFHDFLSKEKIMWKFNLSRKPWWGEQYKRLIVPTKQSLYKFIGKSLLTWSDLDEVWLDVEVNLNNRPLTYTEEDLEYSVLTPNSMILGRDIELLDDSPEVEEVSGGSDRDMYTNARKQLGKDGFIIVIRNGKIVG